MIPIKRPPIIDSNGNPGTAGMTELVEVLVTVIVSPLLVEVNV
jgi:hypothetical protein